MADEAIPEELRDVIKGTIDGLDTFIETEVVPLEQQYKETLADERKLFGDDGLLVPEILEARNSIRRKSAQAGYYAMLAPESIGGGGLPFTATPFILESLYRKHGPGRVFVGWAAAFLTSPILASFVDGPSHLFTGANETVRSEVMPSLLAGEKTVCFGVTEPDAGSDLWSMKCKARRDGDDWVVNGAKMWITNAPYADYAAIFAITNDEVFNAHRGGISCFLVDAQSPGYQAEKPLSIMGHVSSDCGGLSFEDLRVRNDYMIGTVDRGFVHISPRQPMRV